MPFFFKPCFELSSHNRKKKMKKLQSTLMQTYYDFEIPMESEITNESSTTSDDACEIEEESLSLKSQIKDCQERNAENNASCFSRESDLNQHAMTSSNPDSFASDSFKKQQKDSLINVKTIWSSEFSFSRDMEEKRSELHQIGCSKSVERNYKLMGKVREERDNAQYSEEFVKTRTSIGLKSAVENEFNATRKCDANSILIIEQNNSELARCYELTKIAPAKETTSVNVKGFQESQQEKDLLIIENHVGAIAFKNNNNFNIEHVKPQTNIKTEKLEDSNHFKIKEVKSGIEIMTVNIKSIKSIKSKDSSFSPLKDNIEMTKISTIDSTDSFPVDEEFEETTIIDLELSKVVESAISKLSLLRENHCDNFYDSTNDDSKTEVKDNCTEKLGGYIKSSHDLCRTMKENEVHTKEEYCNLLDKKMQCSPKPEPEENLFSNSKYNNRNVTCIPDPDAENNPGNKVWADELENDARKNTEHDEKHLEKEIEQKTVDESTAANYIADKSVNFDIASDIVDQVVGVLLCKKLQATPNFEDNLRDSFDCRGDFVSGIPDSPAAKDIPCRLAAALENDKTYLSSNVPKLINPNEMDTTNQIHANVERKSSKAKRSRNVLLNALTQRCLSPNLIKTNENNEFLERIINGSENSMYKEKLCSENEIYDLSDLAHPMTVQHEEFVTVSLVREKGELEHCISSSDTLQISKKGHTLFPFPNFSSSKEDELSENILGDSISLLRTKNGLDAEEKVSRPKGKNSNDYVNIQKHKDDGVMHANDGNDKIIDVASNEHGISDKNKKRSPGFQQIDEIVEISENEEAEVKEFSNFEILANQLDVKNYSESTVIQEDNKVFEKLSECIINRDDIRENIRIIILKAVNALQKTIVKQFGYEELKTSLEPDFQSTSTINEQSDVSELLNNSNGNKAYNPHFINESTPLTEDLLVVTDTNRNFRLPCEEQYFTENMNELAFDQESSSCTSSSSTISKLLKINLESYEGIEAFEKELQCNSFPMSSSTSLNNSGDNNLNQYLNSYSTNTCLPDYMNIEVCNGIDEYNNGIKNKINAINNNDFLLNEGYERHTDTSIENVENYPLANQNRHMCSFEQRETTTASCVFPANRPSEQGDIMVSDNEEEAHPSSENNAEFGDAGINNCYLQELRNCRVPTLDVSSADITPKISTRKDASNQLTISLNPRRRNLVVNFKGNLEIIPDKTILPTELTSCKSVSIIGSSEYKNQLQADKLKNFEKKKTSKTMPQFDDKKIQYEYQKNLDIFNKYKAEALKPMKQPTRVLTFPKHQDVHRQSDP